MKVLMEDTLQLWNGKNYVQLRGHTRLTLLNSRRGEEPARVTIEEWEDGKEDNWIDKQRLKELYELDKAIIKSLKVTYLTGKGNNHLVPLPNTQRHCSCIRGLGR